MVTPASGDGRLRASHADREQVVDILKAAFVQGRLARDELDARVGQALAARTYADLAALTADLPALPALTAEPDQSPAPASVPASAPPPAQRPRNRAASRAVQVGAGTIAALILAIGIAAVAAGRPVLAAFAAVAIVIFSAVVTAFVASLIAVTVKLESLYRNRSRRRSTALSPGRRTDSAFAHASEPARISGEDSGLMKTFVPYPVQKSS
jgi:hypothetical protein